MATNHISGYTGAISFTGVNAAGLFAPDMDFSASIADFALESWDVTQEQGSFEAYAKAQEWVTAFPSVARWRATVTTLLQSTILVNSLEIRDAATAAKTCTVTFTPVAGDTLSGAAYLENLAVSSPKDGPAACTFSLVGAGALAASVT